MKMIHPDDLEMVSKANLQLLKKVEPWERRYRLLMAVESILIRYSSRFFFKITKHSSKFMTHKSELVLKHLLNKGGCFSTYYYSIYRL
jgi:hypothetical protein